MANLGKFPGTEIEVFSKYPDSYRLDQPNFGDVSKTAFAKGVISDFKIDDPSDMIGTIQSQVKVTGGWGESDWIPLFYHPKAQYWDDDNFKAIDFDQGKMIFKKTWMSFRCGDEVAVMVKAGTPVAVMGFADGVPRIGENILKVSFDTVAAGENYLLWGFYGQGEPENYPVAGLNPSGGVLNPWNGEETGPDNLPLGLKTECPLVASGTVNTNRNGYYIATDYFPYTDKQAPFGYFQQSGWEVTISGQGTTNYIREWLIPCGPFMYLISVLFTTQKEKIHIINYPGGPLATQWDDNQDSIGTVDIAIQSALFNKDVYDKLSGAPIINNKFGEPIWYTVLDGFQYDNNNDAPFKMEYYNIPALPFFTIDRKFLSFLNGTNDTQPPDIPDNIWNLRNFVPLWETAKFFVRPHTKVEFQAASMWPAGAS